MASVGTGTVIVRASVWGEAGLTLVSHEALLLCRAFRHRVCARSRAAERGFQVASDQSGHAVTAAGGECGMGKSNGTRIIADPGFATVSPANEQTMDKNVGTAPNLITLTC